MNQQSIVLNAVGIALALILLASFGGYFVGNGQLFAVKQQAEKQKTEYQAVLLVNGSLYFGRLSGENTDQPVLTDVYYLQAQTQATNKTTADDLKLIKLGNEIQGPTDEIRFNPNEIVFVQDLKDDGQVVKTIKGSIK